jgi:hypothetical protein
MASVAKLAEAKMIDLYNNHSHEVGSRIASSHPGKAPTDCITYVINVLKHAFEKGGDTAAASEVGKLGKHGTKLAAYLVNTHKWVGIYYNPDVNHPRDGDVEHPYSYRKKTLLSRQYFDIPISYWVINYNPTPKTNPNFKSFSSIGGSKDPTPKDTVSLDKLKKVSFAFGISRGGKHTWLYSLGKVYEVHWDRVGSDLYEATNFEEFPWLSGALVAPPDAIAGAGFDEQTSRWEILWEPRL